MNYISSLFGSLQNMCPCFELLKLPKISTPSNLRHQATAVPLQVTYTWPHGHWLENLVAVSGAWVLPGGTAFYLYGNEVGEVLESPFVERFFGLGLGG